VSTTFVILGAGGDLTSRLILPALGELHRAECLPADLRIVAVARRKLTTEQFLDEVRGELDDIGVERSSVEPVLERIEFVEADATDADAIDSLPVSDEGLVVVYLALPPAVFADAFRAIAASQLRERVRLAIEKPFGEDLDSARALNAVLGQCFEPHQVRRVDHFLGHPIARSLLGLRSGNRLLDAVWNAEHVARIDVVWDETLALEGRAGYYDGTGALRDMLQNHLLQLTALLTMDLPADDDPATIAAAKLAIFEHIEARPEASVRGRYSAGEIDGTPVPAYVDEDDVDPARETETYAEIELAIDTERWRGVPVRLRSGKALGLSRRCMALAFRPPPGQALCSADEHGITLGIEPGRVEIRLGSPDSGNPFSLGTLSCEAPLPGTHHSAYARVLRDLFEGDQRFFVSAAEAEEQWRIVTPVLEAWAAGRVALEEYPAGSDGPEASRARTIG
jgi:glucose-6-phosphate 1-dehydrogenase